MDKRKTRAPRKQRSVKFRRMKAAPKASVTPAGFSKPKKRLTFMKNKMKKLLRGA